MEAPEASLYELLQQARIGDEPTAMLDATCLAIIEEIGGDTGPLEMSAGFLRNRPAIAPRRTVIVECARRIDV